MKNPNRGSHLNNSIYIYIYILMWENSKKFIKKKYAKKKSKKIKIL